jgi:hypothetical protein
VGAAAADVEIAVRRHFESEELVAAAGPVLEFCSSVRALGLDFHSDTTIRSLTVVSVRDDEADVELDAVEYCTTRGKRGQKQRTSVSLTGTVRVRRAHGEWAVVDHCLDGRPISESFFSLAGDPVRAEGLSLRLSSISLERQGIRAFLEVENSGSRPATIGRAALAVGHGYCAGGKTLSEFAAGTTSTVMLGWPRKSLSPRAGQPRLRLDVRTAAGRHVAVVWTIDMHERRADGSLRGRGWLRVLLASSKMPPAFAGLSFVALVGMIGIPPLKFFVTLALGTACIAACTMAYVFAHDRLQRR